MDQPGVTVEGEDDRLVRREQGIEILVGQSVRMLTRRLQLHEIHDVDHAHLDIGQIGAQQRHGRQRFQRGYVAATGHHDIRFTVFIVARPFPDADAGRAMRNRLVHVEPLRRRLFARDDDVDVITAAQTVVGDGQERIGVGRQIDPDHLGLLIHHMVDESRVLVAEPVVILPPDVGG
ncbi:MAG: hypothetical protein EWM73_03045 [Nitrospira sp.]|nr:MAG: hypothetical protein EWM73_03045 [Nitrospira sp.]